MFHSYFYTALRNFAKAPAYSLISILGLTLGLACATIILIFITYLLSYDRDYPGAERIYTLFEVVELPDGGEWSRSFVGHLLYEPVLGNSDLVEQAAHISPATIEITEQNDTYTESVFHTDNGFFSLFNVAFLKGEPNLDQPDTLVISDSAASKYFGDQNPVGETLQLKEGPVTVTGVFEDFARNTHFHKLKPDMFMPVPHRTAAGNTGRSGYLYVKLKPGVPPGEMERQVNSAVNYKNARGHENTVRSQLKPVINSHMVGRGSELMISTTGTNLFESWFFVYVMSVLAVLILSISCINFISLTTARFLQRNREIGVRKAIGADRRQVFGQLLSEAFILNVVAALWGLAIADSLLPLFGNLINMDLTGIDYFTPAFVSLLCGLVTFSVLLSGFYPAWMLSRINAVTALQNTGAAKGKKGTALRVVNVLQFAVAILLITPCLVLGFQVNQMRNMDYGADLENTVDLRLDIPGSRGGAGYLREVLSTMPNVLSVSASPTPDSNDKYQLQGEVSTEFELTSSYVDARFFQHIQTRLVAGRLFHDTGAADEFALTGDSQSGPAVLSQAGLARIGYRDAEQVIGQRLQSPGGEVELEIVGVVSAFPPIFARHSIIGSDLFMLNEKGARALNARIEPGRVSAVVSDMEQRLKALAPSGRFSHTSPLQPLDSMENTFLKMLASVAVFSIVAITIAILGLYAVSTFSVGRRTREISLRKVLGASSWRIVALLLWDFSKPIWIALALATPLAYLLVEQIVSLFENRIPLGWVTFICVPLVIVAVTWLTVGAHTLRAAGSAPMQGLKCD